MTFDDVCSKFFDGDEDSSIDELFVKYYYQCGGYKSENPFTSEEMQIIEAEIDRLEREENFDAGWYLR